MQRYTVTDKVTGDEFLCREDESLLAAMTRSGKGHIRYGCGGGGCGVCKVRVLEGEFLAFKAMSARHIGEEERERNEVLACCVKPRSDIVLCEYAGKEGNNA